MSIADEMVVLRKQLAQLQSKLKALESRLEQEVSARIATIKDNSIINDVHSTSPPYPSVKSSASTQKSTRSAQSRDPRTLRSRSFKVMRHLINIVDVSRAASAASELEKKGTTIDSSRDPIASVSSVTELKSSAKPTEATNSPTTELKASVKPKKATNSPSKGPSALLSSQKKSCVSSLSLQPLIDSQPPVAPISIKKRLTPPKNPKTIPSTSSSTPRRLHPTQPRRVKLLNDLPSTHEESDCKKSQYTSEVIEYNELRRGCGRFSLLKYDPAVLDLLPASVRDRRFVETKTVTDVENLPQALANLVRRQVLGIWEWKAGTSRATLHEYKTPELGTTISNRRFKFVGFAWKGALGQQPPRIEELHEDISQGADTLRWYWFKDLWLLFYFD
ncbi:hypothetical protein PGTUg99_031228 [Puccinia graminis f. sp. tritici]|uniref:Uncharacterized protein n=1 Tax=Puccinia graminis f. sp. tritici TaxID=56615 RepID=A0A5B0PP11_PUCGR|nr:hypothetical protein PGTUg99_031228 [Puccinia graminis f. sp. tritici]